MKQASFPKLMEEGARAKDTALCVGLDPRLDRIPEHLLKTKQPLFEFCRAIVDATADLACAFKPQIAYFAAQGAERELEAIIDHVHRHHPGVPVILDAKRNDIGETARQYARELFARYQADAATVNPYLGWDSLQPYLEFEGKGVVVLCHTSNPDSAWMQEVPEHDPIYLRVASLVAEQNDPRLMLVVGATFPEQLGMVRKHAPRTTFLVPGIGAQGGAVDAVFAHGLDDNHGGLVVNASRGVIYAGSGKAFAEDARRAAQTLRDDMRRARDAATNADRGSHHDQAVQNR